MEPKWQRISFMPATPLGEDGRRVTGSAAHIALSRRAAAEGMVLLKNENETLPLKRGSRVAVFGKAQADYVKGGGGSGDTTVAYVRSLAQGLRMKQDEGKIEIFEPLERFYAENVKAQYAAGATPGKTREPILDDALVRQARAFTDTAVITICRFSGEDYDRTGQPHDGDYFLSFEEEHMVKKVLAVFPRVAVVLNTGGMMDTLWFKDNPAVGAALLAWQGGMEGGLAAADLLVGDVCPSGHLTDTFASSFAAYPSSANFAESRMYVEYQEDVFVGYRYFETIPGAADEVCYPFGYGLSYTTFALRDIVGGLNDAGEIELRATVHNTGTCAGKYVLQAYVNPPKGRMAKPATALVGFAKTRLLEPDESETLTIAFAPYAFAAYDDEGVIQKSAYVLEKGEYRFRLGGKVRAEAAASPYAGRRQLPRAFLRARNAARGLAQAGGHPGRGAVSAGNPGSDSGLRMDSADQATVDRGGKRRIDAGGMDEPAQRRGHGAAAGRTAEPRRSEYVRLRQSADLRRAERDDGGRPGGSAH